MVHRGRYFGCVGIIFLMLFPFSGARGAEEKVSEGVQREMNAAADLYPVMQEFNQDLELLRRYMGVSRPHELGIRVHKVARYDVYFQALTLFQKANQLSFEISRLKMDVPALPEGPIRDLEVAGLITGAHQALHAAMAELKVEPGKVNFPGDAGKSTTDVFESILSANRQLNLLLDRHATPNDCFQEVTLAIGYAAQLLAMYPLDGPWIPEPPPFEEGKGPIEVYSRLLRCLTMIADIFQTAGFEMLVIDSSAIDEKNITPGDVFDLTSLIVAQLDFLHRRFSIPKRPRESFYPGRKYPTEVYQQVGILEAQLQKLQVLLSSRNRPHGKR